MRAPAVRFRYSRVMVMLLGVAVGASVALCVLAWRLALLDAALRDQLAAERLEQAADLARSSLLQHMARTGEELRVALQLPSGARSARLSALAEATPEATAALLNGRSWALFPDRPLRYVPGAEAPVSVHDIAFAGGEALEHRDQDYAAAARWFRKLAIRSDGTLQAGALLRAARNEIKLQQPGRARTLYEALAQLGTVSVDGEPAALVGAYARLQVLDGAARGSAARELLQDLENGRWLLSRASYRFYRDELVRMVPSSTGEPFWEEVIGAAAAFSRRSESGERVAWVDGGQAVLVIWRSHAETMAAIAITPLQIARWLSVAPEFTHRLETPSGRTLVAGGREAPYSERVLSFGGQDWRLLTTVKTPAAQRDTRPLLWLGLMLLILLVLTGSYAVMSAVSRELAVARLQTDFVSAVSHEFRSPLTTLRSMSEMLEHNRVPTEDRKQRYYELMSRETTRLHTLVENLLDFGRMEAGARVYNFQPTDAGQVTASIVAEFQEAYAAAGFHIDLGELQAAPVLADADALATALRNLLDNAVKYSGAAREVRVSARTEARRVIISVEDHGPGIRAGDLKRIFRKFERGTEAAASSIPGTGLGLALVSTIIRAHGGRVTVRSRVGEGSTFSLELPCVPHVEEGIAWSASS